MASVNATDRRGGLHERRKAAGLSQQRLAELAGCSLSMVRVLESGYEPEHSEVLPRVLAALIDPSTSETRTGNPGLAKLAGDGDGHGSG